MIFRSYRINESATYVEGNEDAFLKLGEVKVYDNNLKSIITVPTEDFVKVVTDAMFMISKEYKFLYAYLKYSKVFYIPSYPSAMGINTMAVDEKKNLWMNVHFIYNCCKMDKNKVFGIIFHELMHIFFKHQTREEKMFPKIYRTKDMHMKSNICQDFEVNASMVSDEIVPADFWEKMGGLYDPKYSGKRWEDIMKSDGDKEYEKWLVRSGVRLDEKTKEALKAIEKAVKVLKDKDSTLAEKEHAKDELRKKMDELYGKKDRKIVDKADISGLRRELSKLFDTRLSDIGDVGGALQDLGNDLKIHPKDMSESEIKDVIDDIKRLRKNLLDNADVIGDDFRKPSDDVKRDVKQAMQSLAEALDVLHDGGSSIRDERRVIRKAKDDLEGIIMNDTDKKIREEKREDAIRKHKEKLEKSKGKSKDSDESEKEKVEKVLKRNPIKKFVDTFRNLQKLRSYERISDESSEIYNDMIFVCEEMLDMNIKDIRKSDIDGIFSLLPKIKESTVNDIRNLKDRRIIRMSNDEIDKFVYNVFDTVKGFFDVISDDSERASVKFGAMSLAVEELRKLGKLLKTQKKIYASEEFKEGYKETRKKLMKIYKEGGRPALETELSKPEYE